MAEKNVNNDYSNLISYLKLTMFNIIADQESKLAGLVDYLNQQPENTNINELVDMYNKQRGIVSSLTIMTNDLSSILTQLDTNEKTISEYLSSGRINASNNMVMNAPVVNNVNVEPATNQFQNVGSDENVSNEDSESNENDSPIEEVVVNENNSPIEEVTNVEQNSLGVEEENSINNVSVSEVQSDSVDDNTDAISEVQINEDVAVENVEVSNSESDPIKESIDGVADANSDAINNTITETVPAQESDVTEKIVESNEEISAPGDAVISTGDDSVKEEAIENVVVETKDEIVSESENNASDDSLVDGIVETKDETIPVADNVSPELENPVNDESSVDGIVETKDENVSVENNVVSEEQSVIKEESPIKEVVEENNQVIPMEEENVQNSDVVVEVKDINPVIEEKPTDNVIQIKSESLDLDDDDDIVDTPIASLSSEQVDESSETRIDFVAINPNIAHAILINKKQAGNLRASLISQTELFNAFVVKSKSGDIVITADNIEEMLEKATALYSEGKVEESEKLMQKIDEFREKSQSVTAR